MKLVVEFFTLLLLSCCSGQSLRVNKIQVHEEDVYYATYYKNGTISRTRDSKEGLAWASFKDSLLKNGWGELTIQTSKTQGNDTAQYYAAGYIEGMLTAKHILDQVTNLGKITFPKTDGIPPAEVVDFMSQQDKWMRKEMQKHRKTSSFWRQAEGILQQFDGLMAGYNDAASVKGLKPLGIWSFQLLNALGDLFQIIPAVKETERVEWLSLTSEQARHEKNKRGHCSALIKLTGDFDDLLFGHSSWFNFGATNRIFKHYSFDLTDESTSATTVSFSSYAGFLYSLDDFYMMQGSKMGMTQTSNDVMNHELLDLVKPESLLAWHRVRIASVMANSGKDWHTIFSKEASGTYANQYMVIDFKLFEPKVAPLKKNLLWVVEEIPGLVLGSDQTETLARGYWPSYNIPFYTEVFERSGYQKLVEKFGESWTYQLAPRAKIFRRDNSSVQTLEKLKQILRYNDYKTDPYSLNEKNIPDPMNAICSRGDLNGGDAEGCYDTKVTSYKSGFPHYASAISGPTRGENQDTYPPFAWSEGKVYEEMPHQGLPRKYDFDFIDIVADLTPTLPVSEVSV
eukprot:g1743.t1